MTVSHKLTKISLTNFRKFQDVECKVGKKLTVISGINAIGKSNILSLIAACSGSPKKKSSGGNFQPEFVEYFKFSPDDEELKKYEVSLDYSSSEDYIYKRRLSFNDYRNNNRGIRVIPRSASLSSEQTIKSADQELRAKYGFSGASRVPIPTVFISLSRLFPVGEKEATLQEVPMRKNNSFYQEAANKYKNWYNQIFPNSISNIEAERITKNGKTYYFLKLDDSSAITQSVGQDNLGNIISSLVDFYLLKQDMGNNYPGGILCIDELDASLHPSAQLKLISLLNLVSEELNLQIFLTTHSLIILKELLKLENQTPQDYSLLYFQDSIQPQLLPFKSFESVEASLFEETSFIVPKVKVYCEDEVGKKLLEILLQTARRLNINTDNLNDLDLVSSELGNTQLIKLPKKDNYFRKVAILVDGDTKVNDSSKITVDDNLLNNSAVLSQSSIKFKGDNICALPSFVMPEVYLYRILNDFSQNSSNHITFWTGLKNNQETSLITVNSIKNELKLDKSKISNTCSLKDLVKEKGSQMLDLVEKTNILIDYYNSSENKKELQDFIKKFQKSVIAASKSMKAGYFY